jgi:hypothetical protein
MYELLFLRFVITAFNHAQVRTCMMKQNVCYVILLCCVMLRYVMLCYAMLCYVMLCFMLCYAMLCYVMLRYMLCYVMFRGYGQENFL